MIKNGHVNGVQPIKNRIQPMKMRIKKKIYIKIFIYIYIAEICRNGGAPVC